MQFVYNLGKLRCNFFYLKLKKIVIQIRYFFRTGWVVGWVGGVEKLRLELTSAKFR